MVKQFILLIQLIGVFIYQLVLTGDVTVTQNVPSSIATGSEGLVEITVNKGEVTGFAKVQQDVPAGFVINPVETKGATFSFKDNRIKFIWMALPAEESFTVSYTLKPLAETKGEFSLGGKFSYISNSERQNVEIPVANFSITDQELVAEETTSENTEENSTSEEENQEEVVAENTAPESEEESTSNEEEQPEEEPVAEVNEEETTTAKGARVTSSREIAQTEEGKFTVTITLNKQNVMGFAKISEQIPSGFVATEVESQGGVFSFREQTVKILWMAIPKGDEMKIAYQLQATTAENESYNIKGAFAYLENDVTAEHTIASSSFTLSKTDEIAEVTEEESTTDPEETTDSNQASSTTSTEEETNASTTDNTTQNVTNTPAPETGVSYKVQVGAGHQTVPNNWFAMKFNLTDEISTENHEGWIKYVVGSYSVYKDARDKRNTVRTKVRRAFVTAYSSGKRITVQEALMISNQKWYK